VRRASLTAQRKQARVHGLLLLLLLANLRLWRLRCRSSAVRALAWPGRARTLASAAFISTSGASFESAIFDSTTRPQQGRLCRRIAASNTRTPLSVAMAEGLREEIAASVADVAFAATLLGVEESQHVYSVDGVPMKASCLLQLQLLPAVQGVAPHAPRIAVCMPHGYVVRDLKLRFPLSSVQCSHVLTRCSC
jgi:hypothetical protein